MKNPLEVGFLTEEVMMNTTKIFRSLVLLFRDDISYQHYLMKAFPSMGFNQIIPWFMTVESILSNDFTDIVLAEVNPVARICSRFSSQGIEQFFENRGLNLLFRLYAP